MIDQKIINAIKSLINDIKKENDIVNEIIRDDVFQYYKIIALSCIILWMERR